MAEVKTYYAFFDNNYHRYYYLDMTTQETTWDYPEDAYVLDPETQEPFINPLLRSKVSEPASKENTQSTIAVPDRIGLLPDTGIPKKPHTHRASEVPHYLPEVKAVQTVSPRLNPLKIENKKQRHRSDSLVPYIRSNKFTGVRTCVFNVADEGDQPFVLEIEQSVVQFDPAKFAAPDSNNDSSNQHGSSQDYEIEKVEEREEEDNKDDDSEPDHKHGGSRRKFTLPRTDSGFLPVVEKNPDYSLDKFAKDHFNKPKKGKLSREQVSVDSLISFESKPISNPLLQNLPSECHKAAIKLFTFILMYTKVQKCKSKIQPTLQEFVRMLQEDPRLIDEAYFQVMKQTNGNPPVENLIRAWELLLTLATIFPSTKESELWIKSHIAKTLRNNNRGLKLISTFTFIRYTARMTIGQPMEDLTDEYISNIPTHPLTFHTVFGASLYEVMWCQRRQHPNCPIPYFLIEICAKMNELRCKEREGVFRMPGSMKRVDELAVLANEGHNVLEGINLDDCASLMKKWFRDISGMIVPINLAPYLSGFTEKDQFIEFAASLPPVNSMTLAYLIGFLQELSVHQEKTKMGVKNLAMVFSPNIVQFDMSSAVGSTRLDAGVGQFFLEQLIENWDVSLIYPIQLEPKNQGYKLNEVL